MNWLLYGIFVCLHSLIDRPADEFVCWLSSVAAEATKSSVLYMQGAADDGENVQERSRYH